MSDARVAHTKVIGAQDSTRFRSVFTESLCGLGPADVKVRGLSERKIGNRMNENLTNAAFGGTERLMKCTSKFVSLSAQMNICRGSLQKFVATAGPDFPLALMKLATSMTQAPTFAAHERFQDFSEADATMLPMEHALMTLKKLCDIMLSEIRITADLLYLLDDAYDVLQCMQEGKPRPKPTRSPTKSDALRADGSMTDDVVREVGETTGSTPPPTPSSAKSRKRIPLSHKDMTAVDQFIATLQRTEFYYYG